MRSPGWTAFFVAIGVAVVCALFFSCFERRPVERQLTLLRAVSWATGNVAPGTKAMAPAQRMKMGFTILLGKQSIENVMSMTAIAMAGAR